MDQVKQLKQMVSESGDWDFFREQLATVMDQWEAVPETLFFTEEVSYFFYIILYEFISISLLFFFFFLLTTVCLFSFYISFVFHLFPPPSRSGSFARHRIKTLITSSMETFMFVAKSLSSFMEQTIHRDTTRSQY